MRHIEFNWDDLSEKNNIRFAHRTPYTIKAMLKPRNTWLAGGALRGLFDGTPVRDYDLFFNNGDARYEAEDYLHRNGAKLLSITKKGWVSSYDFHGLKVQLIFHTRYKDANHIIGDFDLVPSMFATDGVTLFTTVEAIRSATTKRLHLNKVTNPLAVMSRIAKYTHEYGYYLTEQCAKEFVKQVRSAKDMDKNLKWGRYLDEVEKTEAAPEQWRGDFPEAAVREPEGIPGVIPARWAQQAVDNMARAVIFNDNVAPGDIIGGAQVANGQIGRWEGIRMVNAWDVNAAPAEQPQDQVVIRNPRGIF